MKKSQTQDSRRRLFRKFAVERLESRRVLAQMLAAVPNDSPVELGEQIEVATNYATNPVSETGGVSLRLHYNPALVSFDLGDLSFPDGGPTPQGSPFIGDDASDFDNDPTTTNFVQLSFSADLTFPTELTPLFSAMFTAIDVGTANFNYSFQAAPGETESTSVSVTINEAATPPTQTLVADPVTQTVDVNDTFTISTNYSTIPASQTGGVSLRLHYNPALVSFDLGDLSFPDGGPTPQGAPFIGDDASNFDDDPTTTNFVQLSFSADLTFPTELTPLFSAMFTAIDVGTANFNYSFQAAPGETESTSASVTINESPPLAPTLSIASTDATRDEGDVGNSNFTFTLTRGVNTLSAGTVDFAVTGTGGNSASPGDFAGGAFPSGTISFDAGQATATITVNVAGDTVFEADELFTVTLSNASGGATISTASASGTIRNDDAAPLPEIAISSVNAVQVEGNSAATAFTFTVSRTGSTTGTTTADFVVSGGTVNAADFLGNELPRGTVTFEAGETTKTVTVNISGDSDVEADERFVVMLSNASDGAVIVSATAEGLIQDDDRPQIRTRILTPSRVATLHVIPGDSIPTAIIFQAFQTTSITVVPMGTASVTETIRILDHNLQPISTFTGGVAEAFVVAGTLNAIIFEPQTMGRVYSIRSSAGFDTVGNGGATNLFQPTDTNGDGATTTLDALLVINEMVEEQAGEGEPLSKRGLLLDVNADGNVTALDALIVINHLNRSELPRPTEGESLASVLDAREADLSEMHRSADLIAPEILLSEAEKKTSPSVYSSNVMAAVVDMALSVDEDWKGVSIDYELALISAGLISGNAGEALNMI
jgi:hypothetical protein